MTTKSLKKGIINFVAVSLILTSTLIVPSKVNAAVEVTRMPGADRFITAENVAKQTFKKADNVILVNGLGYADAVSAAPLAKLLNAPILLTDGSKKPSMDLLETLTELGTKKVYIVGGEGVVKKSLEQELAKSFTVERLAGSVKDGRYGTNATVAKKVLEKTGASQGMLVSAEGYADALSIASIAATKGYPILFGNKSEVPKVVKDAASKLEISAIGGEGVLPDKVLSSVDAKRIAKGLDRFDTNLKVIEYFKDELNFDNLFIAAGGDDSKYKFADALVASAAAAKYGSPVILNGLGAKEESRTAANECVMDNMTKDSKITIIGGAASVDVFIEGKLKYEAEKLNNAGNKQDTDIDKDDNVNKDNDVDKDNNAGKDNDAGNKDKGEGKDGITVLSLKQVKIVFSTEVNKDQAEDLINYQLDGENLKVGQAKAKLLDDEKTVIITFEEPMAQGSTKVFTVRDGLIKEKNTNRPVPESEKKLNFM